MRSYILLPTWSLVSCEESSSLIQLRLHREDAQVNSELVAEPLGYGDPEGCGTWSEWGACSKSCGGGYETRTYSFHAHVTHDGLVCGERCPHGNGEKQSRRCNEKVPCPVPCVGSWSPISDCSHTCGGGTQERLYTISQQAAHGGEDCPEECGTEDITECGTEECVKHCKGHFEDWTECLGTGPDPLCGGPGSQSRGFTVTQEASPGGCSDDCHDEEIRSCELPCCTYDCEGSWSEWGKCEGAQSYEVDGGYGETECCGGGKKTKTFTITKEKECGGACCPAVDGAIMEADCCTECCPEDCEGHWEIGIECTTSCDPGTTTDIFKVTKPAKCGGAQCEAKCGDTRDKACTETDVHPPTGKTWLENCPGICKGHWGEWSKCSTFCENDCAADLGPHPSGSSTRAFIVTKEATYGGEKCSDKGQTETRPCPGAAPCPVDAVCKWGEWGECSEPCSNGPDHYIFKKRKWIEVKPAKDGGCECKDSPPAYEPDEEPCVVDCCPEPCVGGWGPWGYCSAACGGGSKSRFYSIEKESKCGGRECCHKHGDEQAMDCGMQCCAEPCEGKWSAWSKCSTTCSNCDTLPGKGGTRFRTFEVSKDAQCGGNNCSYQDGKKEVEKCNEDIGCIRHCEGDWTPWSDCSQPCTDCETYGSVGSKSRKFIVTVPLRHGGNPCVAEHGEVDTDNCNEDKCCPKPCEGKWTEFSECSASCGNGAKKRTFHITQPALHGGKPCEHCHNKSHTVECNEGPCAVDCCGKWSAWGHCCKECGGGQQTSWFQITTPAQNGGKPCEAGAWETKKKSCNEHDCFQPCIGGFSQWSKCDAACGGGTKSRTYTVEQPLKGTPPMIPGFAAGYGPGPGECAHADGYVESKGCNQHACPLGYECPKDKPCNAR